MKYICNRQFKIILLFVFICMFFLNLFSNNVYAALTDQQIDPKTYQTDAGTIDETTKNSAGKIIGAVQAIGTIVSVLALVLLGIKFMLGSAEEKADYQQWMGYYIVGAILVFGIVNISAVIYKAVNS